RPLLSTNGVHLTSSHRSRAEWAASEVVAIPSPRIVIARTAGPRQSRASCVTLWIPSLTLAMTRASAQSAHHQAGHVAGGDRLALAAARAGAFGLRAAQSFARGGVHVLAQFAQRADVAVLASA